MYFSDSSSSYGFNQRRNSSFDKNKRSRKKSGARANLAGRIRNSSRDITPSDIKDVKGQFLYSDSKYWMSINRLELVQEGESLQNAVMMLSPIKYTRATVKGAQQYSYTNQRTGSNTVPLGYDRMLFAQCVNCIEGNNIVAFPIGKGQNMSFFQDYLCQRPNGVFSKYSLVDLFPYNSNH